MQRVLTGKEARMRWGVGRENGWTDWGGMDGHTERYRYKERRSVNDKANTKYRKGEKQRLKGNIFQSEADYSLFRHVSYRLPMPLAWLTS